MYGPRADSEEITYWNRPFVSSNARLRKLIADRDLTGLANNAKWNELFAVMRSDNEGRRTPCFRCGFVDSDYIADWDAEWFYHLPLPAMGWSFMDLDCRDWLGNGQKTDLVDRTEVESIVKRIGFDYEISTFGLRIFGYAPRDYREFENT